MKRLLFKVITITLILSLIATTGVFAAVPEDVKGQSYEEAVTTLVEKGIITGDTDGSFHPDSELTRAQACVIIVKSMNAPSVDVVGSVTQPAQKSGFSDMSGYGWAEGYINYAVVNNVVKGYPDGTFKPGNKVTMNELVTMVLRAADYTDENLGGTWPSNYTAKALELSLLENLPAPMPTYATKWMAAQLDYNALDKIVAANPETPSQGNDGGNASLAPDTANMEYATGSFNATMTSFAGKAIAKKVIIYTYGKSSSYSSTMTFSKKPADYQLDTIYKYKLAKTPAFYSIENNEITEMVLPMDVGFSGNAFVVINDIVTTVGADGTAVPALETLTAAREISWLGKSGFTDIPASGGVNGYLNGTVYEVSLSNGIIKKVSISTDIDKSVDTFEEISGATPIEVTSFNENVVGTVDGNMFTVKENATVYIKDGDSDPIYKRGSLSNIRDGVDIRAYDVLDDDETAADIVVVLK